MPKAIKNEAIKGALTSLGLTQTQLAESVGVSSQAVTNWLKGKDFPRPATLLKIATVLQLPFDQMVEIRDTGKPIVAFRKKANARTTAAHISKAKDLGMLLKLLVTYLDEIQELRTLITSPSTEYSKLQIAVTQVRDRLGIGEQAVLEYEHLIGEFGNCGAVLIPVLWGQRGAHENALHIRLPKEDVSFIYLNLDTRLEDFKFWMAHELAHVYTPELAGTNYGEDYADEFAGALLFPRACAESAYHEAFKQTCEKDIIRVFEKYANEHMISLNTVFQQVKNFVNATKFSSLAIHEKNIHIVRNTNFGPLISEALFDPLPPTSSNYVTACENIFQSDFFSALKKLLRDRKTGPSFLQQLLDVPIRDAHALYEELRN